MARTPKNPPQFWDTPKGPKDHFYQVFDGMTDHPAFRDMSKGARLLYFYCRRESHGRATSDYMKGLFGEWSYDSDPGRLFYMNFAQAKQHELYNDGNKGGLRRDMQELISHGFVDCVMNGGGNRRKALYALSSRYREWPNVETPNNVKTRSMQNSAAKGREKSPTQEKTEGEKNHPDGVKKLTLKEQDLADKGEKTHPPKQQNPSSRENPEGEKTHPERIYTPWGVDKSNGAGSDISDALQKLASELETVTTCSHDVALGLVHASYERDGMDGAVRFVREQIQQRKKQERAREIAYAS